MVWRGGGEGGVTEGVLGEKSNRCADVDKVKRHVFLSCPLQKLPTVTNWFWLSLASSEQLDFNQQIPQRNIVSTAMDNSDDLPTYRYLLESFLLKAWGGGGGWCWDPYTLDPPLL